MQFHFSWRSLHRGDGALYITSTIRNVFYIYSQEWHQKFPAGATKLHNRGRQATRSLNKGDGGLGFSLRRILAVIAEKLGFYCIKPKILIFGRKFDFCVAGSAFLEDKLKENLWARGRRPSETTVMLYCTHYESPTKLENFTTRGQPS